MSRPLRRPPGPRHAARRPRVAAAQPPADTTKKGDLKAGATKKDAAKPGPAEKMTPPPGSVIFLVKDLDKALAAWPEMILLTPAKYQELLDRLATLEKQIKSEKALAHACKLSGRLEGDFITLRAEFLFATETPRATVVLGLQKGHLLGEGELDGRPPVLDYTDEDGFTVRVEKEGSHQLTLPLRVPVTPKRAVGPGGVERGFELGLPGTTVTTLNLELPPAVKELRLERHARKDADQQPLALVARPCEGPQPVVAGAGDGVRERAALDRRGAGDGAARRGAGRHDGRADARGPARPDEGVAAAAAGAGEGRNRGAGGGDLRAGPAGREREASRPQAGRAEHRAVGRVGVDADAAAGRRRAVPGRPVLRRGGLPPAGDDHRAGRPGRGPAAAAPLSPPGRGVPARPAEGARPPPTSRRCSSTGACRRGRKRWRVACRWSWSCGPRKAHWRRRPTRRSASAPRPTAGRWSWR